MDFLNDTLSFFSSGEKKNSTEKSKKRKQELQKETIPDELSAIEISPKKIPPISVKSLSPEINDATVRTNISMPQSLKLRFKAKCSANGQDMSKLIQFWVKQYLADSTDGAHQNEN